MERAAPKRGDLKRILKAFCGRRILVTGDLMLDEYLYGSTQRISREAPVLILAYDGSMIMPGGAGNACANINSLGAVAVPVSVIGKDEAGSKLKTLLRSAGVPTDDVVSVERFETIQKTRVLAGGFHCAKQQVIRIDRGKAVSMGGRIEGLLVERALSLLPSCDAVLFSDYGYGAVSERLRGEVTVEARRRRIPVCVDSRYELLKFRGASVATPNEVEAGLASGVVVRDTMSLLEAGRRLMKKMALSSLVITQGSSGMTVFDSKRAPVKMPIFGSDEIADVTGAGDTVAAAIILSLSAGAGIVEASCIATYASSVVVMKRGTAVATQAEVLEGIEAGRIVGTPVLRPT
ncbi:MAG: bifunctional ADP-heptose synthase [Candidatus Eisenbacteria bacterium]